MTKEAQLGGGSVRLPLQALSLKSFQNAYDRTLQNLIIAEAVPRLWNRDTSLWPAGENKNKSITSNLSWLDLPAHIGSQMAPLVRLGDAIVAEGFQHAVFVALGDSNLAAQSIIDLPIEKRWKRFFVLDSADPDHLRAVEQQLDLERTLFIFANKSGKHIETHSLLLYFLERLKRRGVSPGHQCVAVTEESSYLAELAKNYRFRAVSFDPGGIKGRYSALIHFSLLLSALCRVDPAALGSSAVAMRDACSVSAPSAANPALQLAAFLSAAASERRYRFLLFGDKILAPFTHCIAQLVGVSLSKFGDGLVPIAAAAPGLMESCWQNSIAGLFSFHGQNDPQLQQVRHQLEQSDIPTASIELNGSEELGPELFKWEVATVLASALRDVNPFVEPDCQDGKQRTAELLDTLVVKQELPSRTVRVREGGIDLYAEGVTRQEISTLNLFEALRTFLELKDRDSYVAFLAFIDPDPAVEAELNRLCDRLTASLGVPVFATFGPRYLHCFGQIYKGGPPKGLFLLLTSDPTEDIDIPGAGYSFGQLQMALALGDFDALANRRKFIVHLHLAKGLEQGLAQLNQVLGKI
jgi:hypothetical protein